MASPQKKKSAFQEAIESMVERIIFGGRWLLAPLYVGLLLSLVPLLYRFFKEFISLFELTATADMHHITLKILFLMYRLVWNFNGHLNV